MHSTGTQCAVSYSRRTRPQTQQPPPSNHTTTRATDLPWPQKRGQNFSETLKCRERAHSPYSSPTEAPRPEWPPGSQTSCPITILHDHGLTLATVDPTSCGLSNPINELGLQLPTLATEVGVSGKATLGVGGVELPDTPTQRLLRTGENLHEILQHHYTRTR